MIRFQFKNIVFVIEDTRIRIESFGEFKNQSKRGFLEVHIAGENKKSHAGVKMINSSEGARLKYVSHNLSENNLSIVQESDLIRTNTVFASYNDTNAIRVYTEICNISSENIVVEDVSAIVVGGLTGEEAVSMDKLYFTRFIQSHHLECQPHRSSFKDYGFVNYPGQPVSQIKIAFANIGSWSTKEELPQGLIENIETNKYLMFQIESHSSWYYEISEREKDIYLYLSGANSTYGSWHKKLAKDETYRTVTAAIAFGNNQNDVIAEMTKYRRHICGNCDADKKLPTIFNEYMHLSWDSPTEENTKKYAPVVAKTGIEYYVIDCGWHNEEPGECIYPYVGQWKESISRFPNGIRATTDFIRSLGMKAGLWIEPEIIGVNCKDMLEYYDDDCFLQRHGKKILVNDRYFLDYRHPKVIDYMSETIRRMVEDYGAEYIKFDFNQDAGIGTDYNCASMGEGMELCGNAFLDWVEDMKRRFPEIIFEGCASGGMRMDYKSLATFSLMSTSDQTDYMKYPYIAANVLSAVIPEQAAVWGYPVGECAKNEINNNQIIMNMINSFLGRMHLASHLELMDESQLQLVTDGVKVYEKISEFKRNAVPYMPWGFTDYGAETVSSGIRWGDLIYLAVWNLSDVNYAEITFDKKIKNVDVEYPGTSNADLIVTKKNLKVKFCSPQSAVFLRIELEV